MIQSMSQARNASPIRPPIAPVPGAGGTALITSPIQADAACCAPVLRTVITHEDIAQRAHDIYVRNGFQQGQSDENWQQAERDLRDHGTVVCHAEHRIQGVFAPDSVSA